MTLELDPAAIADALRRNVESYTPSVERQEVGRVIDTGDGIARVAGLPRAMTNELLEFPGGVLGVAFNLDEDQIGCDLHSISGHNIPAPKDLGALNVRRGRLKTQRQWGGNQERQRPAYRPVSE